MKHQRWSRASLFVEQLESRLALSTLPILDIGDAGAYHPAIVAGSSTGTPADSPSIRVDPNTTTSPFAGVGSVNVITRSSSYICTGTPISDRHILTAAHCVDINNDGVSNFKDRITSVSFYLNYGGNLTHRLTASSWQVHSDYTGFARPSVNDDLAVITLNTTLPAGVPIYGLYTGALDKSLKLVGYGRSGNGVSGYTTNASFSIKRVGENVADAGYSQDDAGRPAAVEVFRFDFDGASGNGSLGGPTLGNNRETTLGGGDSGGPSFVLVGSDPALASSYQVAGVNTFTQDTSTAKAPKFGSLGGGIIVAAYASWIQSIAPPTQTASSQTQGESPSGDSPKPIVGFDAPASRGSGADHLVIVALESASPRTPTPTVVHLQPAAPITPPVQFLHTPSSSSSRFVVSRHQGDSGTEEDYWNWIDEEALFRLWQQEIESEAAPAAPSKEPQLESPPEQPDQSAIDGVFVEVEQTALPSSGHDDGATEEMMDLLTTTEYAMDPAWVLVGGIVGAYATGAVNFRERSKLQTDGLVARS